jgi:hypothetical protein
MGTGKTQGCWSKATFANGCTVRGIPRGDPFDVELPLRGVWLSLPAYLDS